MNSGIDKELTADRNHATAGKFHCYSGIVHGEGKELLGELNQNVRYIIYCQLFSLYASSVSFALRGGTKPGDRLPGMTLEKPRRLGHLYPVSWVRRADPDEASALEKDDGSASLWSP